MAKRLSVSVTEDLYEKLQQFKNTLKKPISKICQEALLDEVKKAELIEGNTSHEKFLDLVDRLRKEKKQKNMPFYEEGFRDGIEDAYVINSKQFEDYQYEKNVVDPFYPLDMLDMVASDRTRNKHDCLYITSTIENAKNELNEIDIELKISSFYQFVNDDLIKKGFCDKDGQQIFSWDYLILAQVYFEGWFDGIRSVLQNVESKLYKGV